MKQKIISFNVNGIRAAIRKGFNDWIAKELPDIICIQETKAQADQIEFDENIKEKYHCYWNSAEKKGYSGVGIMTKREPDEIKYGMGVPEYDKEGRIIRADFGETTLICAYIPSGSSGDVRQDIKMKFLSEFHQFAASLKQERRNLILVGDFNICHKAIDIHNPKRLKNTSGFLPEEREWMDNFVESGFIDSFRKFHDDPEQYTWWSFRGEARKKNLGWRIDYQFVSKEIKEKLLSASILSDVNYSDHCPVSTEIDFV